MTYFDNGEGYGDDDDGDEEGPVYWRAWRTSLLKSMKDQSTEEHEGQVYWRAWRTSLLKSMKDQSTEQTVASLLQIEETNPFWLKFSSPASIQYPAIQIAFCWWAKSGAKYAFCDQF